MKKLSIARKTFLSFIFAISCLFFGSFALITGKTANAYTNYYMTNSVSVTNGNFTSYSENKNKLPFSINSGWTALETSTNDVYSGIIDADSSVFTKNDYFTLPEVNPETYKTNVNENIDSKILMINRY